LTDDDDDVMMILNYSYNNDTTNRI